METQVPTGRSVQQKTVRIAHAARSKDPRKIAEARAEAAAERIALYVYRVLRDAPPLTAEQRERINDLLRKRGQ